MSEKTKVSLGVSESLLKHSGDLTVELSPDDVLFACRKYIKENYPAMALGYNLVLASNEVLPKVIFHALPIQ